MIKHDAIKEKTSTLTFMPVLLLAVTLMAGAVFWIFFVGIIYFQYIREPVQHTEGDWSLLNHIYFLILTSPLVIIVCFILSGWIVCGRQGSFLKLAIAIIVFLANGGSYFAMLWNVYPPNQ